MSERIIGPAEGAIVVGQNGALRVIAPENDSDLDLFITAVAVLMGQSPKFMEMVKAEIHEILKPQGRPN